jgi:hypothetical protein
MTLSEANTFLEDASRNERFLTRSGVREEPRSCLQTRGAACRGRLVRR